MTLASTIHRSNSSDNDAICTVYVRRVPTAGSFHKDFITHNCHSSSSSEQTEENKRYCVPKYFQRIVRKTIWVLGKTYTFYFRQRDEEKLALLTRRESNQLIYRMGMLPLHHDNFQTGENLLISRAGSLHNNPVQCEDAAVFSPSQFFSWTVDLWSSQIKQLKHCWGWCEAAAPPCIDSRL